jgi:LacI family transcriptional regulator
LVETDLPVARVADLTGFKHAEHLCVAFKREIGKTPGQYRREGLGS